ncbi:PEP-CTERM sorting domain-containing protein [Planctomycetota bacterium]
MLRFTLFVAVLTLVAAGPLQADIIVFEHTGNTDPTSGAEGWLTGGAGTGNSAGPLTNDAGSGFDAWYVDDNSNVIGSTFGYYQAPTAAENNQASQFGWTLRTRLRVADNGDAVNNHGSVHSQYTTGSRAFLMAFGSEADGDPIVSLWNDISDNFSGTAFTLQGSGGGYHLYELAYDPVADSADLFVDGVERISDFLGVTDASLTANVVAFGSGSSYDTGQGNYNLVQWELSAVPEPSSLALLGSGAFIIGVYGYFRRRREQCRTP